MMLKMMLMLILAMMLTPTSFKTLDAKAVSGMWPVPRPRIVFALAWSWSWRLRFMEPRCIISYFKFTILFSVQNQIMICYKYICDIRPCAMHILHGMFPWGPVASWWWSSRRPGGRGCLTELISPAWRKRWGCRRGWPCQCSHCQTDEMKPPSFTNIKTLWSWAMTRPPMSSRARVRARAGRRRKARPLSWSRLRIRIRIRTNKNDQDSGMRMRRIRSSYFWYQGDTA